LTNIVIDDVVVCYGMVYRDIISTLNTNLLGPLLMSRAVLKHMIKQKYGRIISIGSIVGRDGNIGQVSYSSSKSGLDGMTRSLAREVASRGITVNQINPGFITSPMTHGILTIVAMLACSVLTCFLLTLICNAIMISIK
jgi:NAD(P)-dependent dehydrogenase (short-subunit alcohol dehydrogenase family)